MNDPKDDEGGFSSTPSNRAAHADARRALMETANATLFNCCKDNMPPDWSQFDAIEVWPVKIDEGLAEAITDDDWHEATVWSVYGHCTRGGVECITDVSTKRLSLQIAAMFERTLRERGFLEYPRFEAEGAQPG